MRQQMTKGEWKIAWSEARTYAQTSVNVTPEKYQHHLWFAYQILRMR